MRSLAMLALSFLFVFGCSGCSSTTQAAPLIRRDVPAVYASNAYAPSACAPAVVSSCGPSIVTPASVAYDIAPPTGVEFTTGPAEQFKSVLVLPGGWVDCGTTFVADVGYALGKGLKCLGSNLVPTPQPSMRYVYGQAPNACSPNACALPSARPTCGPSQPTYPAAPPPPTYPTNPNDPPESIPAVRRR